MIRGTRKSQSILLVSFVQDNRWSGMGKWTHSVAEAMGELGHRPILWFSNQFPWLERHLSLALILFPMVTAWRIWRRRDEFDAVVIHEPGGFWYGLLRKAGFPLPPMTLMCHNVESKHFAETKEFASRGLATLPRRSRWKMPLVRYWQTNGAIRFADHVLCLSSIDRQYIMERLHVPGERVTRMVNGVSGVPEVAARSYACQRVLFVGGWLDVKGRRVLPALWSAVHERLPQAKLTIVGAGKSPEEVLQDFAPSTHDSITVVTRLTGEAEMLAQYAEHDFFLMPSLSEGSSLALLEAMAAGLAIVATRVGGNPDLITHDIDGLLFGPEEPEAGARHVCRLLEHPEVARRLAESARRRTQAYTWEAIARIMLRAIESAQRTVPAPAGKRSREPISWRIDD